jgi:hypothetical protein
VTEAEGKNKEGFRLAACASALQLCYQNTLLVILLFIADDCVYAIIIARIFLVEYCVEQKFCSTCMPLNLLCQTLLWTVEAGTIILWANLSNNLRFSWVRKWWTVDFS